MKVLVVGLGSMGKRRIRNLLALQVTEVAGVDPREDRRNEAASKYGVRAFADHSEALRSFRPDALVISTPPDQHMHYAWDAFERDLPCFIEASVVDADRILALHRRAAASPVLIAPSCTMRYYPGPKKVAELIAAGAIGKVLSFTYQVGQYLPDWHPWEEIGDYYVSNRATGGCREIVPFELTWLNAVFGEPEPLACVRAKLTDMPADIDDIYQMQLRYPGNVLASLTIEVISRPHATRELRILGSEGELVFSADEKAVRVATAAKPGWQRFSLEAGNVEAGYINPEEPYIEEMRMFLEALSRRDKSFFPNTLEDDARVLQLLYRLEAMSGGSAA